MTYVENSCQYWLDQLPEPYRSKALNNFNPEFFKRETQGDNHVKSLANAVEVAFAWANCPEEHRYWLEVYEYLTDQKPKPQDWPKDWTLAQTKIEGWVSVADKPLFYEEGGRRILTETGDGEFVAAIPYSDTKYPGEQLWQVVHCHVDTDGDLTDSHGDSVGWSLEDVDYYIPIPSTENLIWK